MTEEKKETYIDRLMSAKGDEIRTAREKLGLSQAELALRAGTNQQTIDRLERSLTRQSKYMPEIRKVLGLPFEEPEDSLVRFSGKYNAGFGVRAHLADEYQNGNEIPVFSMVLGEEDGQATWILQSEPDFTLPRSYPVADSRGAYGVIVPDDRMSPVLKEGEIAIVDPDAGGEFDGEVFMLHGMRDGRTAGMLCTWSGYDNSDDRKEEFVRVRFWNPPERMLARWLTWPAMGAVVARLPKLKK